MTDEQRPGPVGDVDCGDAPLYVLGLMDSEQRARFIAHAQTCVVCRDEIASLRPAARVLDEAVPRMSAPRRLRRRVLTAVRAESVSSLASSRAADGRHERLRTPLLLSRPRSLAIAAVSCALLVVGGAIGALVLADTPGSQAAHTRGAEVSVKGVSAVLHRSGSHIWLTVSHMPPPGRNHVYEIWVERDGAATPLPTNALFSPTSSGACTVAVPGNPPEGSEVLVTSEPDGGTLKPTNEPVIVARV